MTTGFALRPYAGPGSLDYDHAVALLNGRPSKKVANNTYARREGDDVVIRLHETDILTFRPNGDVVYNSGDWLTVTTKERMNSFGATNITISQTAGRWYVFGRFPFDDSIPCEEWRALAAEHWKNPLTDFYDGMTVNNGQVVTKAVHSEDPDKAIKRKIDRYVKGYTDEEIKRLVDEAAEHGTNGDCWYCMMRTTEGKVLGEAFHDTDHLLSHLDEDYRMATLAYNAVEAAGYSNPVVILNWSGDLVRRSIRKYLRTRLATHTARS